MTIDRKYTVERDGKTYALYAGLLDAAHEKGLLSIETALVQIPTPENANVAICTATVRMGDKDGVTRTFTGIGDASPTNVNRMMAPHIIRMAETRSKARALRDAINLAEALADDPTEEQDSVLGAPVATPSPARPTTNGRAHEEVHEEKGEPPPTEQQRQVIAGKVNALNVATGKKVKLPFLRSERQANAIIDELEVQLQTYQQPVKQ